MIFKNSVGVRIFIETSKPLASVIQVQMRYKKPSGATGLWNCDVANTSQILYTTQTNDLDEVGIWNLQPIVTRTGSVIPGSITQMKVEDIL